MATESRVNILNAADDLFGRLGFDAASTREIAACCGVNKALIHYHFQTKDDLFNAVLDRYYQQLEQVLREALIAEGPLLKRMGTTLDVYVDFLADNPNFSRIVQREASGGKRLDRIVTRMTGIFEMGVELLREEYPVTRGGDLAAPQVLVSFYGMVVSYFTYSPVLEGLLGSSPLSPQNLERRKRHLHRMLEMLESELREESKTTAARKRRKK